MTDYGYSVEVVEGYDEAVIRTRLALRGEGFSILTEMPVPGALDPAFAPERQYLIMGAWDTRITQPVGGPDVRAAIHFPCNVVVQETGSVAVVAALDPSEDVDSTDDAQVAAAGAARGALERALRRIAAPDGP